MKQIYILFPIFILVIIALLISRRRYSLIKKTIADVKDKYPDAEKIIFSSLSYKDDFSDAATKLLQLMENSVYLNDDKIKKKAEELKKFSTKTQLFYKILVPAIFILALFYLIMIGLNKGFL